jgi:hypothetical protein
MEIEFQQVAKTRVRHLTLTWVPFPSWALSSNRSQTEEVEAGDRNRNGEEVHSPGGEYSLGNGDIKQGQAGRVFT